METEGTSARDHAGPQVGGHGPRVGFGHPIGAAASGAGDRLPEWLLKIAVERGATHYQRDFDPSLPPDNPAIPDEEIGIALCLGQTPYHLDNLRAAAQLLSSPRVDAATLCRLAVQERCEPVLLHIATVAERFVPALEPWAYLRQHLPARPVPRPDALPHWSRSGEPHGRDGARRPAENRLALPP